MATTSHAQHNRKPIPPVTPAATESEVLFRFPSTTSEREARIERIREQLVAGTYETEHKLDLALDRLLDDLTTQ